MKKTVIASLDVQPRSRIDSFDPTKYFLYPEDVPRKWLDICDDSPRQIKCVSNGELEELYLQADPEYIDEEDIEDLQYYLDAALSRDRLWHQQQIFPQTGEVRERNPANVDGKPVKLQEGRTYTLSHVDVDEDCDLGLVWIDEIDNDYGFPAFLFEELRPVSRDKRLESIADREEMLERELEELGLDDDIDEDELF